MDKYAFHVHTDLDVLRENVPLVCVDGYTECYVMQENRIVFIGTKKQADVFVRRKYNQNKLIEHDYKNLGKQK